MCGLGRLAIVCGLRSQGKRTGCPCAMIIRIARQPSTPAAQGSGPLAPKPCTCPPPRQMPGSSSASKPKRTAKKQRLSSTSRRSESSGDVELLEEASDAAEQQSHAQADGEEPYARTPDPNPEQCPMCGHMTLRHQTGRCVSYVCSIVLAAMSSEVTRLESILEDMAFQDVLTEEEKNQQGRVTPGRQQETGGQAEQDKGGQEDCNEDKRVAAGAAVDVPMVEK